MISTSTRQLITRTCCIQSSTLQTGLKPWQIKRVATEWNLVVWKYFMEHGWDCWGLYPCLLQASYRSYSDSCEVEITGQ